MITMIGNVSPFMIYMTVLTFTITNIVLTIVGLLAKYVNYEFDDKRIGPYLAILAGFILVHGIIWMNLILFINMFGFITPVMILIFMYCILTSLIIFINICTIVSTINQIL